MDWYRCSRTCRTSGSAAPSRRMHWTAWGHRQMQARQRSCRLQRAATLCRRCTAAPQVRVAAAVPQLCSMSSMISLWQGAWGRPGAGMGVSNGRAATGWGRSIGASCGCRLRLGSGEVAPKIGAVPALRRVTVFGEALLVRRRELLVHSPVVQVIVLSATEALRVRLMRFVCSCRASMVRCGPATWLQPRLPHGLHCLHSSDHVRVSWTVPSSAIPSPPSIGLGSAMVYWVLALPPGLCLGVSCRGGGGGGRLRSGSIKSNFEKVAGKLRCRNQTS